METQKTPDTDPMLDQCWASVVDQCWKRSSYNLRWFSHLGGHVMAISLAGKWQTPLATVWPDNMDNTPRPAKMTVLLTRRG